MKARRAGSKCVLEENVKDNYYAWFETCNYQCFYSNCTHQKEEMVNIVHDR